MSAQPAIQHHLLTVDDYHRMAEVGIFTEDEKTGKRLLSIAFTREGRGIRAAVVAG